MAKLRTNHTKHKKSNTTTIRIIGFLLAVALVMWSLYQKLAAGDFPTHYQTAGEHEPLGEVLLPASNTGQVVRHQHYTLSYSEAHEQAEWVAYQLTEASLRQPNVPRAKRFEEDPLVATRSAHHRDYIGSGYSRGHLAPAGDMAFDEEAMEESFYMSNMSPQLRTFNGGIWKELEETVRDWAYHNNEVYVVTGPVLTDTHVVKTIGKSSKVSVSDLFYKVVLDYREPEVKAIGFLIPNELSERPLAEYAVTIDSVEEVTGIDFFAGAFSAAQERNMEGELDISEWKFSEKRFLLRVDKWNNQ